MLGMEREQPVSVPVIGLRAKAAGPENVEGRLERENRDLQRQRREREAAGFAEMVGRSQAGHRLPTGIEGANGTLSRNRPETNRLFLHLARSEGLEWGRHPRQGRSAERSETSPPG